MGLTAGGHYKHATANQEHRVRAVERLSLNSVFFEGLSIGITEDTALAELFFMNR